MRLNRRIVALAAMGMMTGGLAVVPKTGAQPPTGQAQQEPPAGRGQAPDAGGGRGQGGRGAPAAPIRNPVEGNVDAIRAGGESYRGRCASCHGADAKGTARGSDVMGLWAQGSTDVQIFQSARRGIPNTLLPHSYGPDSETWAILAYLRTLGAQISAQTSVGNPENGGAVFATNCSNCHRVNGRGGHLGPDLSRVGSSRSRALLAHKIRHASTYFYAQHEGGYVFDAYQPVTLITRDGQRIRAIKKNEDAFSIQIMDTREHVQGYVKANLQEFSNDSTSLMPDFAPDKIRDRDLEDLVSYLAALRDTDAGRR
jgi:putative heme-binding domain-containing protein